MMNTGSGSTGIYFPSVVVIQSIGAPHPLQVLTGSPPFPAADLALYPEGSPEHIRAEHSAANTSRTVFELFGAAAAEALREEAVQKWPKLGGIA